MGLHSYLLTERRLCDLEVYPKLWGRRALLRTKLAASFSQSVPVSPFPIFILPQSLCSLQLSSATGSRTYPCLTCLVLCQAPNLSARLFVQPAPVFFPNSAAPRSLSFSSLPAGSPVCSKTRYAPPATFLLLEVINVFTPVGWHLFTLFIPI